MKVYLAYIWEKIRNAFWIIPLLTSLFIITLLFLGIKLKIPLDFPLAREILLFKATPDGARVILGSIATSIMTVVGVLFSITVVVLQQASSQYTPRVVQNFVRSFISQLVLGFFLGTFIYSLLLLTVIQTSKAPGEAVAVPQLALTFAIILSVSCILLLIIFIHHIASSIQSTNIINNIMAESLRAFKHIISDRSKYIEHSFMKKNFRHRYQLCSNSSGYLQDFKWQKIRSYKTENGWKMSLKIYIGSYIHSEQPMAELDSEEALLMDELTTFQECFIVGPERTNAQDPMFGVRKMVDIGVRALSPGINDPTTAQEALNGITEVAIHFIKAYPITHILRFNTTHEVIIPLMEVENFIALCFDQLIQFSKDHAPVRRQIEAKLNLLLQLNKREEVKTSILKRMNKL